MTRLCIAIILAASSILLSSCTRNAAPERGTRLAYLARNARLNGNSTAEFPCPAAQQVALGDLSQATKYATVAIVEPAGRVVSPAGGDEIRTWFKFRILEMLHDRGTAGMPLVGVPPEFLPVAQSEFVTWYCGGKVTINGVEITEAGAEPPEFHEGHRYLMWFELTRAGYGGIGWRDEGVFTIDGDAIRPITPDSANSQVDREILQQVGPSVTKVRQYLAAHP